MAYNFIGGAEQAGKDGPKRFIHELNTTLSLGESVSVAGDAIYGHEEKVLVSDKTDRAEWYSFVGSVRVGLGSDNYLSPRYQIYRDQDGVTLGAGGQTLQSMTLTYSHMVTKGLESRAEFQSDLSNQGVFLAQKANKKSQTTAIVSMLLTL